MTGPGSRPTDVRVLHRWVVAGEITRAGRITIGVLPARTTIAVALREEH